MLARQVRLAACTTGTSGITINSGGTLLLSGSNGVTDRIKNTATMTLNGGIFNTGGLSEHGASNNTAGIGALTLQTTSTIDMGSAASIIAFADSHLSSWSGTLNIINWSGNPATGGGTDEIFVSTNSSGLTASQLAEVHFYSGALGVGDYGPGALLLSNGELVPIPEPRTWLAAALALGAIAYSGNVLRAWRHPQSKGILNFYFLTLNFHSHASQSRSIRHPSQRRIDALLIVIIAIAVAILLLTGSHGNAANNSANPVLTTQNSSH